MSSSPVDGTRDSLPSQVVRSAAMLGLRGLSVHLITVAGTVVLARELSPSEFGLIVLALTLATGLSFVAGVGLAAALVRTPREPAKDEVAGLFSAQLLAAGALTTVVALASLPFGVDGAVVAIAVLGVPLAAVRMPVLVALERNLRFRPIALTEVAETLLFYACAAAVALAGWGPLAVACASALRAAVGSLLLIALSPAEFVRPSRALAGVRASLAFGVRFQAFSIANVARDQALNAVTVLVAGTATLGVWTVARRSLDLTILLFSSLWRVSYPAMARVLRRDTPAAHTLEKTAAIVAAGAGLTLAPLVAAAPSLVPTLVGPGFEAAVNALPWAALGLMIGGPVSVACAGYLWASGDTRTPLITVVVHSVVWISVGGALLPSLGVVGLGIGWAAGACTDAAVLGYSVRRAAAANVLTPVIVPAACAIASATVGWAANSGDPSLLRAFASAMLAGTLFVLSLAVLNRRLFRDLLGLVRPQSHRTPVAGVP